MKLLFLVVTGMSLSLIAGEASSASSASSASASGVASPSPSHKSGEGTISGSGTISVLGNVVEVKDGVVTVNGASFGPVPTDATVHYIVSGANRSLFVNGELRKPVP